MRFLKNIKYWFMYRFHPKHQYHIVKTGLKPGYYDIDIRMERAMISLLIEFVEQELPHNQFYDQTRFNEIIKLYNYFKPLIDTERRIQDFNTTNEYAEAFNELTENLKRLVELRVLMWT